MPFMLPPPTMNGNLSIMAPIKEQDRINGSLLSPKDRNIPSPCSDASTSPSGQAQLLHELDSCSPRIGSSAIRKALDGHTTSLIDPHNRAQLDPRAFLDDLKHYPFEFCTATQLTLEDEMVVLRKRKAVINLSLDHQARRNCILELETEYPRPNSLRSPVGFPNPGNFCYRRSVMQSLLNLYHFRKYLQRRRLLGPGCTHSQSRPCLFCAYHDLATACNAHNTNLVANAVRVVDEAAVRILPASPQWARNRQQHDAHDFLLSTVQEFVLHYNNPNPVVEGLFKLQTSAQYTCVDCNQESSPNVVDNTSIQCAISRRPLSGPVARLEELLDAHFRDEPLGVVCGNCGTRRDRIRKHSITAAPKTLFIQLMRFSFSSNSQPRKLTQPVQYPKTLDLSKYAASSLKRGTSKMLRYDLSSVVGHSGSLNSGHYICWVSNAGGVWRCDDRSVTLESKDRHLNLKENFQAYILVYTSCDGTHHGASDRPIRLADEQAAHARTAKARLGKKRKAKGGGGRAGARH